MEGRRAIRARNISKKFTCSSQLLPRFTDHEKFGVTRAEENIIFQWHGRSELLPFVPWRGILVYKGNENYSREPRCETNSKQSRREILSRCDSVHAAGISGKGTRPFSDEIPSTVRIPRGMLLHFGERFSRERLLINFFRASWSRI